jgi:hypothetical protein
MTCGRTCVATDVGGVSEAVGDTGLVVPPGNAALMAEACLTLLRDDELRHRYAAAARARALEYFTIDGAISRFDEIYSFVAAGHPLPIAPPEPEADDQPDATLVFDLLSTAPSEPDADDQPDATLVFTAGDLLSFGVTG